METMRLIWLAENQDIDFEDILYIAEAIGSPLRRRRNVDKILASLCDVGLLARNSRAYRTTAWAKALRRGAGQWESSFNAAVHALYAWGWDENCGIATPCWSYREVCQVIRDSGVLGISIDEIVLKVVDRAQTQFGVSTVSFSRSSVAGILGWIEAQSPPLIERQNGRVCPSPGPMRSADTIDSVLSAAAHRIGNPLRLEPGLLDRVAATLLLPQDAAFEAVRQRAADEQSVVWIDGVPPAILISASADPFLVSLADSGQSRAVSTAS
jgi:hypothetical protein